MKILFSIGLISLLAFTHPFARDGSVDNEDAEIFRERIERLRENEKAMDNAQDSVQREEDVPEEEAFDTKRSDKEKAEGLVR